MDCPSRASERSQVVLGPAAEDGLELGPGSAPGSAPWQPQAVRKLCGGERCLCPRLGRGGCGREDLCRGWSVEPAGQTQQGQESPGPTVLPAIEVPAII